jgi:oligoribonuclease NrnB/cAMP/cGMP phosphodiesterase (DHH superfamily)
MLNYKDKIVVCYHGNCMDGIASAYCVYASKRYNPENVYLPLTYNKDKMEDIKKNLDKNSEIWFVDFSLSRSEILELSRLCKKVVVIDHHITAEEELKDIKKKNIEVVFDMNKSGCVLVYEYLEKNKLFDETKPNIELLEYIQDRDLWKWELEDSKELNEALYDEVKDFNNLKDFETLEYSYNKEELIKKGKMLLDTKDRIVKKRCYENNLKLVDVENVTFLMVNATEFISDVGNYICDKYNRPAIIFTVMPDKVLLSFRSTDSMEDASIVAKKLGGGGHRNACGAHMSLEDFFNKFF